MAFTMATDKRAQAAKQPHRYWVEETPTIAEAKALADYLAPRTDPDKWAFEATYGRVGNEPAFPRSELFEKPNGPGDGDAAEGEGA
jgi:hypothetical protein